MLQCPWERGLYESRASLTVLLLNNPAPLGWTNNASALTTSFPSKVSNVPLAQHLRPTGARSGSMRERKTTNWEARRGER